MSQTLYLRCPICQKLGKLSVEPRPPGSQSQYRYAVHCWSCADGPAPSPSWFLPKLAQALGCRTGDLLFSLTPYEGLERGSTSNGGAPPPMAQFTDYHGLLDPGVLERFQEDLPEYPTPQDWLARRGIKEHVWRKAGLGWVADYGFLVIPYPDGMFKVRSPRDSVPTFAMRGKGRAWPLYVPNPPRVSTKGWCLLLEGETDALRAESSAIPAVGLPLGAAVWHKDWEFQLSVAGVEHAYVCLDVGAEAHARECRSALLGADFAAEIVDLRSYPFNLYRKNADLSEWLNEQNGGARHILLDHIKQLEGAET